MCIPAFTGQGVCIPSCTGQGCVSAWGCLPRGCAQRGVCLGCLRGGCLHRGWQPPRTRGRHTPGRYYRIRSTSGRWCILVLWCISIQFYGWLTCQIRITLNKENSIGTLVNKPMFDFKLFSSVVQLDRVLWSIVWNPTNVPGLCSPDCRSDPVVLQTYVLNLGDSCFMSSSRRGGQNLILHADSSNYPSFY